MKIPELWFIRHGETDWNKSRRVQGQTDIPLNETGHAQAAAIASTLAGLHDNLEGFDLHVSPLKRPRQTMQAIVDHFDVDWKSIHVDDRISEICFGEMEGKTWPELNAQGIKPELDPEGFHGWRPTGGESYADATVRVRNWLSTLSQPTIAVAHGGVSRIIRGLVLGLPLREIPFLPNPQWKFYRLRDGGIDWFRAERPAARS